MSGQNRFDLENQRVRGTYMIKGVVGSETLLPVSIHTPSASDEDFPGSGTFGARKGLHAQVVTGTVSSGTGNFTTTPGGTVATHGLTTVLNAGDSVTLNSMQEYLSFKFTGTWDFQVEYK